MTLTEADAIKPDNFVLVFFLSVFAEAVFCPSSWMFSLRTSKNICACVGFTAVVLLLGRSFRVGTNQRWRPGYLRWQASWRRRMKTKKDEEAAWHRAGSCQKWDVHRGGLRESFSSLLHTIIFLSSASHLRSSEDTANRLNLSCTYII